MARRRPMVHKRKGSRNVLFIPKAQTIMPKSIPADDPFLYVNANLITVEELRKIDNSIKNKEYTINDAVKQLSTTEARLSSLLLLCKYKDPDIKYSLNPHVPINVVGPPPEATVKSLGIEQPYRVNLMWALEAAGNNLRTGKKPDTCPNNSAFFLYKQALDNPKEFSSKLCQIEAKRTEHGQPLKQSTAKSIAEIDFALSMIESSQ